MNRNGQLWVLTVAMLLIGGAGACRETATATPPRGEGAVASVGFSRQGLLTHTGGLTVTGDAFWEVWDANSGKTTTTHMARDLAALPLSAQPGERFEYGQTGASYEVLGAVIEIASRQTLEAS